MAVQCGELFRYTQCKINALLVRTTSALSGSSLLSAMTWVVKVKYSFIQGLHIWQDEIFYYSTGQIGQMFNVLDRNFIAQCWLSVGPSNLFIHWIQNDIFFSWLKIGFNFLLFDRRTWSDLELLKQKFHIATLAQYWLSTGIVKLNKTWRFFMTRKSRNLFSVQKYKCLATVKRS